MAWHQEREGLFMNLSFLESFTLTFRVGKSGAQGRTYCFLEESLFSRVKGIKAPHYHYNDLHTSIPQYLRISEGLFLHMAEKGSKSEQKGR